MVEAPVWQGARGALSGASAQPREAPAVPGGVQSESVAPDQILRGEGSNFLLQKVALEYAALQ